MQVTSNGIKMEAEFHGDSKNPVIQLIMGLGSQLVHWNSSIVDGLVERGFAVIVFDNRDIGLSQHFDESGLVPIQKLMAGESVETPYSLEDMAADTVGVLDAFGVERAHIVGASMGGMIAQQVAIQYGDRARSLVSIMSSSGDPSLPPPEPHAMEVLMKASPPASDREACISSMIDTSTAIRSPGYVDDDDVLRERCERVFERSYHPDGSNRQLAAIMSAVPRTDSLPGVNVPTMVLHGRDDPLVPLAGGEHVASLVPGARMVTINGMAHDFTEKLAPVYVREIGDFCRYH